MSSIFLAFVAFLAVAASALAGLGLAGVLPRRRGFGARAGLALALSLLLGAEIAPALSASYGGAREQTQTLRRLAVAALAFDLDLKLYGPEAAKPRDALRADLELVRASLAGEAAARLDAFNAANRDVAALRTSLAALQPTTDAQRRRWDAADARLGQFADARLEMALRIGETATGAPLLATLGCACLAFGGLGALGRGEAGALVALLLGAGAVAGALFVVAELNRPYSSLQHGAQAALDQAIAGLGR